MVSAAGSTGRRMPWIDRYFQISSRGSTITREVRGAAATFLTMAYILVANPAILAAAGVPRESAVACTALAASICCILMGLWANFPLATASGMGVNALVAFTIAKSTGSWQTAMGLVVIDGIVVLLLVLAGFREAVMAAIPRDLRIAVGAGIGLFIAFIGFNHSGLIVHGPPNGPPVGPGKVTDPAAMVALFGLAVTMILMAWRIKAAILFGIIAATAMAFWLGVTHWPAGRHFPLPSFAAAFHADVRGALRLSYLPYLLALVMIDFFDTLGTATAVAEQAKLIDKSGQIPRLRQILMVDGVAASVGGLLGVSSVTAYIESAAGVAEGARTGLHSVVVGILFAAAIIAAPLAAIVPDSATAPALILVGFLMMTPFAGIDFRRLDTAIPAFITLLTIPFTYSISHGIGYGFVAYVLIKLATLRVRDVHPAMYVIAGAFVVFFIWG